MAKKIDLESTGGFGDDFSFDEFDSGEVTSKTNPAIKNGKRKAVTETFTGAISGATSTLTSPATAVKFIKTALPKQYGTVFNEANKITGEVSSLYNDAAKELKPHINEFTKQVNKLVPDKLKRTKGLLAKLEEATGKKTYSGPSEEDIRNQGIENTLGEIFKAQAEDTAKSESQAASIGRIRDKIDNDRHNDNFGLLNSINMSVSALAQYNSSVNANYQRKSLELQLRSYYVQADLLNASREHFETIKAQQDAIVKNTALPEYAKIKESERFKESMRNRFMDNMGKGLFGDGDRIKQGFSKLRKIAMEKVGSMKEALAMGLEGAEMLQMSKEQREEMGQSGVGFGNMIGGMVGSGVAEHYVNKAGVWVNNKIAPKGSKIDRFGHQLVNGIRNKDGSIRDLKNSQLLEESGDGGMGDTAKRMFKSFLGLFEKEKAGTDIDTKFGTGINDLQKADTGFNNRTQTSIVTVIPGYLAKILKEVSKDKNAEELEFDHESQRFVTGSENRDIIKSRIEKAMDLPGFKSKIDYTYSLLVGDTKLKAPAEKALKKVISKKLKENGNNTVAEFTKSSNFKGLDEKNREAIMSAISKSFGGSVETAFGGGRQAMDGIKESRLISSMESGKHAYKDLRGELTNEAHAGNEKQLLDLGYLVKDKEGNISVNVNKQMAAYNSAATSDDTYERTSDVHAKGSIKKVNPKSVLEGISKLGSSTWKYLKSAAKFGKGDGGVAEHIGPMAQDLKDKLGEEVAPGGTKVDLVSANGANMAAIGELHRNQQTMAKQSTGASGSIVNAINTSTEAIVAKLDELNKGITIGLGGTLDFISRSMAAIGGLDYDMYKTKLLDGVKKGKQESVKALRKGRIAAKRAAKKGKGAAHKGLDFLREAADEYLPHHGEKGFLSRKLSEWGNSKHNTIIGKTAGLGARLGSTGLDGMGVMYDHAKRFAGGALGVGKKFGSGLLNTGMDFVNGFLGTKGTASPSHGWPETYEAYKAYLKDTPDLIVPEHIYNKLKDLNTDNTTYEEYVEAFKDYPKLIVSKEDYDKLKTKHSAARIKSFAGRIGSMLGGGAKNLVFNILPKVPPMLAGLLKRIKKGISDATDPIVDVYVKGRLTPVLKADVFKANGYFDQFTTKVIERPSKIKGPVIDHEGNVKVSMDDIAIGLVDAKGNPIRTPAAKLATAAAAIAAKGFTFIKDMTSKLMKGVKDHGIFGGIKDFFSGIGGGGNTGKETIHVLKQIRDMLNDRLSGKRSEFNDYKPSTGSISGAVASVKQKTLKGISILKDKERQIALKKKANELKDKAKGNLKSLFRLPGRAIGAIGSGLGAIGRFGSGLFNGSSVPQNTFMGPMPQEEHTGGFVGPMPQSASIADQAANNPGSLKLKGKGFWGGAKSLVGAGFGKAKGLVGLGMGLASNLLGGSGSDSATPAAQASDGSSGGGSTSADKVHTDGERSGSWKDKLKDIDIKRKLQNAKKGVTANLTARYKSATNVLDGIGDKAKQAGTKIIDAIGGIMDMIPGGKGGAIGRAGTALKWAKNLFTGARVAGAIATAAEVGGVGAATVGGEIAVAGATTQIAGAGLLAGAGSAIMAAIAPFILPAIAIAAIGTALYFGYKYLRRDKASPLEQARMTQYGLTKGDKDLYHLIYGLEEKLQHNCIVVANNKVGIKDGALTAEVMNSLAADFDISPENKVMMGRFQTWMAKRFLPVFLVHLNILNSIDPKFKLKDVNDLKDEDKLSYLNKVVYDDGPYDESTSPFKDYDSLVAIKGHVTAAYALVAEPLRRTVNAKRRQDGKLTISGATDEQKEFDRQEDERNQKNKSNIDKLKGTGVLPYGAGSKKPGSTPLGPNESSSVNATVNGDNKTFHSSFKAATAGSVSAGLALMNGPKPTNIKKLIRDAAEAVGIDPDIALAVAAKESNLDPNAKNKDSSARGLFQFVDSTWYGVTDKKGVYHKGVIDDYGAQYGITKDTSPTNPVANALLGAHYLKNNMRILSQVKPDLNETDLYMAHFLGPGGVSKGEGGAKEFLAEDGGTIAAKKFPKAANSNIASFYEGGKKTGRPLTVAEVYTKFNKQLVDAGKDNGVDVNTVAWGGKTSTNTSPDTMTASTADTSVSAVPTKVLSSSTPKAINYSPPSTQIGFVSGSKFDPNASGAIKTVSAKVPDISKTPTIGGYAEPVAKVVPAITHEDVNNSVTGVNETLVQSLDVQTRTLDVQTRTLAKLDDILKNLSSVSTGDQQNKPAATPIVTTPNKPEARPALSPAVGFRRAIT